MAWPMPPTGSWNPGMAMTPDMSGYSAEQWAALQQNWQQWAQWQQQYAQWQNQYGDKYAEQMRAMQTMGGMPPLPPPNTAPPPAPPPPDKPPPPPHENNQPLYNHTAKKPPPISQVPVQNQKINSNLKQITNQTNNQNWPSQMPPQPNIKTQVATKQSTPAQSNNAMSANIEALKKLAEEERLFDTQFSHWEKEIEKWRKENQNHPDRKAYDEYEQKFEACRLQLMERRQQMKLKRDRLMSNMPQAPITTKGEQSTPTPNTLVPPKNVNLEKPQNMPPQSFSQPKNYPDNRKNSQFQQYQQYNNNINRSQPSYDRSHNKNTNNQDRNKPYQNMNQPIHVQDKFQPDNTSFLPTSTSKSKGIPGLDLVPDSDKGSKNVHEVVDITDETIDSQDYQQLQAKGPDYSTISKGINSILGDEKIMNILTMVHNNSKAPPANQPNQNMPRGPYPGPNRNNYENQQFVNKQPNMLQNRQPPNNNQNMGSSSSLGKQNINIQEQYNDRNNSCNGQMRPQFENGPRNQLRSNMSQNDYSRDVPERRPLLGVMPPRDQLQEFIPPAPVQPPRPKWVDEPMFTPSVIVEYEHKPLRLKARDFIDPVHMFDYNHKSKDADVKKMDFEKEADEMFSNMIHKPDRSGREIENDRYHKDPISRDTFSRERDYFYKEQHSRDYSSKELHSKESFSRDHHFREPYEREPRPREPREQRAPREDIDRPPRDEYRSRVHPKDDHEIRRFDDRFEEKRRDDYRDRDRERDRELDRDRFRERDRDRVWDRERDRDRDKFDRRDSRSDSTFDGSRGRDLRKRGHSKDRENSPQSKKPRDKLEAPNKDKTEPPRHIVMIDDILEMPGREMRPEKIVIILRGPPGSGKSYLAKLIRDREAEHGGTARVMSIDDYFMQESIVEEKDPVTGKVVKKPTLKYEYDLDSEGTYLNSLSRAFKRSISDGYFSFLIYDAVNDQLRSYADIWNYSRQNGFQVYICTMELDPQICYKRNIHNRTLEDIQVICTRFFPTPAHHIQIDATTLLQSAAIQDVQMEDVVDEVTETEEPEVETSFTSKWEKMEDADQLARLDGTSKPLRASHLSMEDYLQLDEWKPNIAKPGKKTVRWADIEERREQEKMRAIGFVVGRTDWQRMTDPTMGSSALTQTKYIERVKRH